MPTKTEFDPVAHKTKNPLARGCPCKSCCCIKTRYLMFGLSICGLIGICTRGIWICGIRRLHLHFRLDVDRHDTDVMQNKEPNWRVRATSSRPTICTLLHIFGSLYPVDPRHLSCWTPVPCPALSPVRQEGKGSQSVNSQSVKVGQVRSWRHGVAWHGMAWHARGNDCPLLTLFLCLPYGKPNKLLPHPAT